MFTSSLPIDDILPHLCSSLKLHRSAVLVAPPGAGKTTRVPLALLKEDWTESKKIIMLEPRRLAARSAAAHMAGLLGEKTGETVGLRVRFGSYISAKTRIEVITEGIFTRMILDDPLLEDVGAVIFDEFHERSLDADFGLALALDIQNALREDLRIVVMSATLNGAHIAKKLQNAPVIETHGRSYPVSTVYLGRDPFRTIETDITNAVLKALAEEEGSLLVFLPGQKEIRHVNQLLKEKIKQPHIEICPLYGSLTAEDQDRAVLPARNGTRKIVLATSIAETSLTIEGVRVVIDSGLARIPDYDPATGLTHLKTVKVSMASAEQRKGRAGRIEPGQCYRLWEEAANGSLTSSFPPEILSTDLSSFVLDCAAWGVRDPASLTFLDPPPSTALTEARKLLLSLQALDNTGGITPVGKKLRALALPVRLARMVLEGAQQGFAQEAALLSAVLVEKGLGGASTDLAERIETLKKDRSQRANAMRHLARSWAETATTASSPVPRDEPAQADWGLLLASAYPERIAKQRGKSGDYLMANGRAGHLEPTDSLAQEKYLVVADIQGKAASGRITAACALPEHLLDKAVSTSVEEKEEVFFDQSTQTLRCRFIRQAGALVLEERPLPVKAGVANGNILIEGIRSLGLDILPWDDKTRQWCQRVTFMRKHNRNDKGSWPNVCHSALSVHLQEWLEPFLSGKTAIADIRNEDLKQALISLISWDQQKYLDFQAPSHFDTPAGSHLPIDYSEGEPVLRVRVQELFGLSCHPSLLDGQVPIVLHLLSPAQRAIQITTDLPGFWQGSWRTVKAELKGRYPKHFWPDDPMYATPTSKTKKAMEKKLA